MWSVGWIADETWSRIPIYQEGFRDNFIGPIDTDQCCCIHLLTHSISVSVLRIPAIWSCRREWTNGRLRVFETIGCSDEYPPSHGIVPSRMYSCYGMWQDIVWLSCFLIEEISIRLIWNEFEMQLKPQFAYLLVCCKRSGNVWNSIPHGKKVWVRILWSTRVVWLHPPSLESGRVETKGDGLFVGVKD